MELRALRYFVTVADELHFGRAADRLHIAQPAVSRQIAQLERELGVRLFDRSPRRVRLTAAGLRVLGAAREALAAADRVRGAASPQAGVMRIGTGTGQFTARLERGIDALREQAPAFDVVLVDLPLPTRLNALRQGELDLALARGVRAAPGLQVLPTWTESLFAIVSARHAAAGRAAVGVAELADGPFRTSREHDPSVIAALQETGTPVRAATVAGTIVEVGSDPRSWTVLTADQVAELRSTRVRAIPLAPRTTITGSVVVPAELPSGCASAHRAAFGD
ncbi:MULTISPECIES: LysR family transcriptional regulator [unclassified Amycolatopsis]|uniref:LysR family transcriptional regulator n=1 Tax=unclassified Amycolatopsis TaxID=2618356 RepID=UPI002875B2DA|nr:MULTISPECIES: LysR family transcriptional regulator [unclassified Amycolatopsis]MDS0135962.1 LysR family transcriptional regulator [Amycolatopsis sp. 505]MDS0145449.1 LysR family transcriptional regulator [Amycolatopsis sp. CM201R]